MKKLIFVLAITFSGSAFAADSSDSLKGTSERTALKQQHKDLRQRMLKLRQEMQQLRHELRAKRQEIRQKKLEAKAGALKG